MNLRTIRDAVPGLTYVSGSDTAQQFIRGVRRSAVLRAPVEFAARELLGSRGRVGCHELVGGGVAVLRHRSRDVDIFDEILVPPCGYDSPPEIAERLTGMTRPRVVDLGGNIGLFAIDCLRRYPTANITSIEADPTNLSVLNRCRARNPHASWKIVAAAAGIERGTVRFNSGQFADSAVSEHGPIDVPMIDVFPLLGAADFVKIDIEGSEWPILLDSRFAGVCATAIVLEWHAGRAPEPSRACDLALARIVDAGYRTRSDPGVGHGIIWGWR